MLIAHITDLHVTAEGREGEAGRRLAATLDAIGALNPHPDLIVATGDLTDNGLPEEYAAVRAIFADAPAPVAVTVGNHDERRAFRTAFPETPAPGGFVHYAKDVGPVRVVMADSSASNHDDGAFCAMRARLLDVTLSERPDAETILAIHHPPIPVGIPWMSPHPDEDWIATLAEVLSRHPQVTRIACGHIHRAITRPFGSAIVTCAPATTIQLGLDLSPMDDAHPDGRAIVVDEPPGYVLYHYEYGGLTAHVGVVGDFPVVARYTETMKRRRAP